MSDNPIPDVQDEEISGDEDDVEEKSQRERDSYKYAYDGPVMSDDEEDQSEDEMEDEEEDEEEDRLLDSIQEEFDF